jgi:cation diffusion facilitator CzcD-associated flavoprotein CzcO
MTAPQNSAAPGRVAILGAGPIGLDAALACAERGWPCTVFEAGDRVGGNVRAWGHVRLFTPWSMNVSPRMRDALERAGIAVPAGEHDYPSGAELAERLLEPLAALPVLAENLRLRTAVVAISRQGMLKSDEIGTGRRAQRPFRLLVAAPDGTESVHTADLVIDASGSYTRPNTLGDGGIPAPGESSVADRITRTIPAPAALRACYAGRRVLLVGAGKSAQTVARDLATLVEEHPGTEVVWAVRAPDPDWGEVPADVLPQRQELVDVARALAGGERGGVRVRTGVVIDALRPARDAVVVTLRADDGSSEDGSSEDIEVDQIIALTGFVGDTDLYRQLQVHECYATAAPMNLSAALLAATGDGPADCLAQTSAGVDALRVPEPNFFVLGMKSYGRNNTFLLRVGYEQVDEVAGAYAAA